MKHLCLTLTLLLAFMVPPAAAQDGGEAARTAASALDAAAIGLDQAESARDRVAALTDTVRAYEDGLTAMREGLRAAAIRETELSRKLQAQEAEVQQLLGVLTALGNTAEPQTLLHPQGPLGMARSGMLVASVTPAVAQRAAILRADLQEVTDLRDLQANAAQVLQRGLTGAQEARTALSQAIADRTDLPRRFTQDPIKTEILLSATETLQGFASGLTQISDDEGPALATRIDDRQGQLPLPVRGVILRLAGDLDAAGVARPGIVVATRPKALVTAPVAATIRYSGPLLDYGLVMILEPQPDFLLVLAGLDTVYGDTGQVLSEGSPIGIMGGTLQMNDLGAGPRDTRAPVNNSSPSSEGGGAGRSETLYIEVREGDAPVDPLLWFATDKG